MGIIEYFVVVLIVAVLAYLTTLALDYLAPGHPAIFNTVVWFVAALIIIVVLAQAMGLMGLDPRIPRVR